MSFNLCDNGRDGNVTWWWNNHIHCDNCSWTRSRCYKNVCWHRMIMDIGVSNRIWVWCPHKSIFPCRTSCAQHQQLVDTDIWPCRSCSCSTRHPHLQSYRESGGHLKVTGYLALEFLLLLPRDLDLSLLSSLDRLLYDDLLDSERSDRERRESAAFAADSFFTSSASCVEENTNQWL